MSLALSLDPGDFNIEIEYQDPFENRNEFGEVEYDYVTNFFRLAHIRYRSGKEMQVAEMPHAVARVDIFMRLDTADEISTRGRLYLPTTEQYFHIVAAMNAQMRNTHWELWCYEHQQ